MYEKSPPFYYGGPEVTLTFFRNNATFKHWRLLFERSSPNLLVDHLAGITQMITKKISAVVSITVTLWVGAVVLLFMWGHGLLVGAGYGAPTVWAVLIGLFFLPLLAPYMNRTYQGERLSLLNSILQLAFYGSWVGLGLVFMLANGNSSLLNSTLSVALILALVILLKGLAAGHKVKR
jgi:hypothetical protein